jgi:hypothetical protein
VCQRCADPLKMYAMRHPHYSDGFLRVHFDREED